MLLFGREGVSKISFKSITELITWWSASKQQTSCDILWPFLMVCDILWQSMMVLWQYFIGLFTGGLFSPRTVIQKDGYIKGRLYPRTVIWKDGYPIGPLSQRTEYYVALLLCKHTMKSFTSWRYSTSVTDVLKHSEKLFSISNPYH